MTLDRVIGAGVAALGGVLLYVLIPAHVAMRPGDAVDPSLFPRIAGWMLVVLGLLQIAFPARGASLPPARDFGRLALAIGLLIAAALALRYLGFIPTAVALMAATVVFVHEGRLLWVAITIGAVPVFVWALFELVLERPLP